jgi:hypothetical protein
MLPMISPLGLTILVALVAIVGLLAWRFKRADKTDQWPVTEATIQSVGVVAVNQGKTSVLLDFGDFYYTVDDEIYSGRLKISRSSSTHDALTRALVNQKVQVRYNPRKPDMYFVPQAEISGFLLDPYSD